MFFELVSVIVAGFAGAGVAMLLLRLVGGRLPKWITPLLAGAAMILVAVANEYGWFSRQNAGLPEGLEVAQTHEARALWRPWTYAVPYVDRFIAVDHGSRLTHPAKPELRMLDVYLFARWQPVSAVRSVFDCAEGKRADIGPGVVLEEDGTLTGAAWAEAGATDPVIKAACRED